MVYDGVSYEVRQLLHRRYLPSACSGLILRHHKRQRDRSGFHSAKRSLPQATTSSCRT
jgi:hypothetical protein